MSNGDLYPKGTRLWLKSLDQEVEYVCYAKEGIHIVLVKPLDFLDDRVREVKADDLLSRAALEEAEAETDACIDWIKRNQVELRTGYVKMLSRFGGSPGPVDGQAFMYYAIFRYEKSRLLTQLAPGSRTHQ